MHGPRWFPDVWLRKSTDGNDDLHVVATPAGIVKSKAVRRTASPWKGTWLWLVKDFPYKPNAFPKKPLKLAPGFPVRDKDKLEDKDAQDVLEYALQHGDSSDEEKKPEDQPQQEHEAMETQAAGSELQPELPEEVPLGMTEPKTPSDSGKVLDDSEIVERSPEARRTEPTSPTSPTLSAPFYAGGVNRMTNDYEWEDELLDELGEESYDMEIEDEPDEGKPPQLTPGELQKVDEKAGMVEITRLLDMKVMELPTAEEEQNGVVLSTTSVYDWRFRNKAWQRRCRLVAREFRGADRSTASTFAPTSNNAGNRVMLQLHLTFRWVICFLDVKDAFLLVEQRELILVEMPSWWSRWRRAANRSSILGTSTVSSWPTQCC